MLRLIVIAFIIVSGSLAHSQDKKPKKTPFDNVAGYKVHTLAGFTVIVSQDVLNIESTMFKKKPLDCIEQELKNVAGLVNEKSANALRKVPIWAEWSERRAMTNGRAGQTYAVYYGGNQLSMLGQGMQPLKAKCVTLLLTKELTRSYQDKDRPEELVMLHELAHAVHDQLLGFDNPAVKTAYSQAMGRKLYDKSLYIATNEHEFFAEATCAYLDRLGYFPKNRADLKTHDPQTTKMLDAVWGKASTAGPDALKVKRPPDGSDEFELSLTLDKVRWAKPQLGDGFKPAESRGRVVLLVFVMPDQSAFLNRLSGWREDYEPYGLSIVLANAAYRQDPAETVEEFRKLKLPFPILDTTYLPLKGGKARAERAGHAVLFDAAGQCVFRGQTDDATLYLKEAIGKRLATSIGLAEAPSQLKPAIDALKAGEPLAAVATKAQSFTTSSDAALADPAKKIVAAVTEPGVKLLAEATAMKKTAPLEAFLIAEQVAARFKGLSIAGKAAAMADGLRGEKTVLAEMAARRDFATVMKLETTLTSQAGAFEPKAPSFQAKNAALLRQLKDAVAVMKKKHQSTKSLENALAIAKEYGVE